MDGRRHRICLIAGLAAVVAMVSEVTAQPGGFPGGDRGGRPDWRSRVREAQAQAAEPQTPQIDPERMEQLIDAAEAALVDLRIRTETENVWAWSRGVVLSEAGYAVTPLHPLRDALAVWARTPQSDRLIPVELWDVDPGLDLALIRLDIRALPEGVVLRPIDIASATDLKRDIAWVLGVDSFGRPSISVGRITGLLPYPNLPVETRKAMRFDNMSWWVTMDVLVDVNNSSGPLIDGNGKLAGVAIWGWTQQQAGAAGGPSNDPRQRFIEMRRRMARGGSSANTATNYAIYFEHIRDLLEDRSEEPLTFAESRRLLAGSVLPSHSLPHITVESATYASQLRRATNSFVQATVCPMCQGAGEIIVEAAAVKDQPQYIKLPGSARKVPNPEYGNDTDQEDGEDQTKPCPRCEGTGLNRAENIFRIGSTVATALAALDRTDRSSQLEIVHLQRSLAQIIEQNPQRLVDTINSEARLHLHPTAMKVGEPVLVMGVAESLSGSIGDFNQLTKVTLGDQGPTVLVADPDLADPKTPDIVLVGGILAGYITDENGQPMPVIHRGFLINLPEVEDDATADGRSGSGSGSGGSNAQNDARTREQQMRDRMERWRRWVSRRMAYSDRDRRRR